MKHEITASMPVRIFEFLKDQEGPVDRSKIAEATGIAYENARKAINRMVAAGTLIVHEKASHKSVGVFSLNPEAYIKKVRNGTVTVVIDGKKPPRPVQPKAKPRGNKRALKAAAKAKEKQKQEEIKAKEKQKQEEIKAKEKQKQEEIKAKEKEDREGRAGTRGSGKGEFKDGDDSMFEYQRGYQNGYNDAINHSQKDAYQAGKRVVIEGLLKLLKVDAKVLMA